MRFDCPITVTDLRIWPSRPASNVPPDIFSRPGLAPASGLSRKKNSKTISTKPAALWKPPVPECPAAVGPRLCGPPPAAALITPRPLRKLAHKENEGDEGV